MRNQLSWDKIGPEIVKIYRDSFSVEEIDSLLAFYQSPVGRALVKKTPALMTKAMAIAQARMTAIMPEIQRLTREASQR